LTFISKYIYTKYKNKKESILTKQTKTQTNKSTMKKFAMIIATMAIAIGTFAQVSFFPVKKDVVKGTDTIRVTDSSEVIRVYGGMLSGITCKTETGKFGGFTGIRLGGDGSWDFAKWGSVKAFGGIQINPGDTAVPLDHFEGIYAVVKPFKNLSIFAGRMATLPTEQRPYPLTGAGQFETWTEGQIPGGCENIKLEYQVTKSFQLAAGLAKRNNVLEYSGRVIFKAAQLSGWYSEKEIGSALTISKGRLYTVLVYKQVEVAPNLKEQVAANILTLTINKKHGISFYNDLGFHLEKDHPLSRGECGLLKDLGAYGLVGLGWDYQPGHQWIVGYLYFHL
jgi:hypothetical protein